MHSRYLESAYNSLKIKLQKINILTLNLSYLTHQSALNLKPVQTVVAYMETVPYRDPVAMDQCVWQMEIVMVRVIIL